MVAVVVILGEEGNKGGRKGGRWVEGGSDVSARRGGIVMKCVQRDWKFLRRSIGY